MEESITAGSGTHCCIDGTPFDEDGFCAHGHIQEEEIDIIIAAEDNTHCSKDGTMFDEEGACTLGHEK